MLQSSSASHPTLSAAGLPIPNRSPPSSASHPTLSAAGLPVPNRSPHRAGPIEEAVAILNEVLLPTKDLIEL